MKKIWFQNGKIVLLAVLTLVLAVLTVIEFLPTNTDVEIQEEIKVSSSPIDSTRQIYSSYVAGELFNPTDEEILLDTVDVTVGNGETEKTLTFSDIRISARSGYTLFASWEGTEAFDRVLLAEATSGGKTETLSNPVRMWNVSGIAILCAILALCAGACLFHAARIRYYMEQEKKIRQSVDQS